MRGAAPARQPLRRRYGRVALRVAAALAIGVGVGHGAARLVQGSAPDVAVAEAPEAAVAQALGFPVMEGSAPTGLAEAVLGVEASFEEEGSS